MPEAQTLLAFAAFSAAIIIVPGPSVLFIIGRGVAAGRRVAMATVVGNTAGAVVLVAIVALGLTPILANSDTAFVAIRVTGGAYLLYLGFDALRHAAEQRDTPFGAEEPPSMRTVLRDGFVVGLTNPKLAVFLAAVLPQFVDEDSGSILAQTAALGLVFAVTALVLDSAWALAAGLARDWLATSPRRAATLHAVGGVILIALGGLVLADAVV